MTAPSLNPNALNYAGFYKAIHDDTHGYILYSNATDGQSGRKVFIDPELTDKFAQLVNKDDRGRRVLKRIERLSSSAGGMQSYTNLDHAFEHRDVFDYVQVTYKILQAQPGVQAGVYICNIGLAEFGRDKPGVYRARRFKQGNEWEVEKQSDKRINTVNAAINGLCNNAQRAATDIMPQIVEKVCRDDKDKNDLEINGYSLVYHPTTLFCLNGQRWVSPEQKETNIEVAATILGNVLLQATLEGKEVLWTVHGHGAKLLSKALDRNMGRKLSNHMVFLAAPDSDTEQLLMKMNKVGIKLHKDALKYHPDDWSTVDIIKNRTSRNAAICKQIAAFNNGTFNYDEKVGEFGEERSRIGYQVVDLCKGAAGLGFGIIGSTPALSMPETVTVPSTLYGAAKLYQQSKSIRNMAANNLNDPRLNPHMHPHKSADQFNAHVHRSCGGVGRSFVEVFKKKVWGE